MGRLFKNPCIAAATVVGAVLLSGAGASQARAGFTAVQQSKRVNNPGHERILEGVYGGNFAADATGLNFSNESGVTVTRLQDNAADVGSTVPRDDAWDIKMTSARVVAAFGRKKQTAGYFAGTSNGRMTRLLEATGRRLAVSGACDTPAEIDGELCFGRGRKANRVFSSLAEANRDRADHLVTYRVEGADAAADGQSTYLLCWEDKLGKRSDRDFNDLMVEVKTASSAGGSSAAAAALAEPLLIPLPPALWSGLGGLLGLGAFGAYRRSGRRPRW